MKTQRSDCCLTCCHNRSGEETAAGSGADFCRLRGMVIDTPSATHCANHPLRHPRKLSMPVGPVYREDLLGVRNVWRPSPDTEPIRRHLLKLLEEMPERPRAEYPFGIPFDEIVIWQLGEFREKRALGGLRRAAAFDPNLSDPIFGLNRFMTVRRAGEALAKILQGPRDARPRADRTSS